MSVYLFSHIAFFWSDIADSWELGGYRGKCEEGGGEGKLLYLETIKDVSSALCLVCSHKSAVLGCIQGHDNTHYSHYLPDQPINSHSHDKVPSSEMRRPICSLTVILSEWQVNVFKWKWRKKELNRWRAKESYRGGPDGQSDDLSGTNTNMHLLIENSNASGCFWA